MFMAINLSESEWCRKATPEVPCRTQGFSHPAAATTAGIAGATFSLAEATTAWNGDGVVESSLGIWVL
jgi:hypothetical protein